MKSVDTVVCEGCKERPAVAVAGSSKKRWCVSCRPLVENEDKPKGTREFNERITED